jgi:MFS family permease
VVLTLAMAALVASLTQTLVVPILPLLPERLGVSPSAASWVVTVIVVTAAVANPVLGRLGDQFGLRRVLFGTLTAYVVGSIICALATTLPVLVVGRALQGGATASIPLGISLLAALLPEGRRAVGVALVSAMLGLGGSVGLTISGAIAEGWGTRALFLVPAAVGVLVIVSLVVVVPEPPRGDGGTPLDVPGGLALITALVLVLLPLSRGGSWGWSSPLTLGLAAGGLGAGVVFVLLQLRRRAPMVDLRLAATRPVLLTNLTSVLVGFVLFVNFLGTAAMMQAPAAGGYGFGLGMLDAGLAILPGGVLMACLALVAARVVVRHGGRVTLMLGVGLMTVGALPRLVFHEHLWQAMLWSALSASGSTVVFAAVPALVLATTPGTRIAAANGLNALARSLGLAIAAAVFGVLTEQAGHGLAAYFTLAAAASVVALCLSTAIPRGLRRRAPAPAGVAQQALPERVRR